MNTDFEVRMIRCVNTAYRKVLGVAHNRLEKKRQKALTKYVKGLNYANKLEEAAQDTLVQVKTLGQELAIEFNDSNNEYTAAQAEVAVYYGKSHIEENYNA